MSVFKLLKLNIMNITELARILKITPQELRDQLPQQGFDIGQKAIKINPNVANKIIKNWPEIKRKIELSKKESKNIGEEKTENLKKVRKKILIPKQITVRNFAEISELPVNEILSILMKNGIFTSLNEKIDFETAWLVGEELGLNIEPVKEEKKNTNDSDVLHEILKKEDKKALLSRPPVIVVMGHVDHGKTKLLDAIRRTNVVAGEAGGITQHIGAYQVKRKNQLITFVDTPGHEAFTAMRSRGAKIADIAILVVAADDGVKPQTIEAYHIIKTAGIPFVVAINKTDKPDANIEKTKQELSQKLQITPEDWGGDVICVPISALKSIGIDDLLDMVILTAESEADKIKANPNSLAIGTIIESNIDKGAGPIGTLLVQNGTLRIGDSLIRKNINIGKVRDLKNFQGKKIKAAGPATPVQIIGFKIMPQVGDIVQVGEGIKIKNKKLKTAWQKQSDNKTKTEEKNDYKKINVIIKSDVLGSAEAIEESLMKLNTKKIKIIVIHKGLGHIGDGDIKRAEASKAIIIGFNVKTPPGIEDLARERKVEIKLYNIIYDIINDIKEEKKRILGKKIVRVDLGKLKVKAIFRSEKKMQIIGGKIIEGRAEAEALIDIERNGKIIGTAKMLSLKSGKEEVATVEAGEECGISLEPDIQIIVNDILLLYKKRSELNDE